MMTALQLAIDLFYAFDSGESENWENRLQGYTPQRATTIWNTLPEDEQATWLLHAERILKARNISNA